MTRGGSSGRKEGGKEGEMEEWDLVEEFFVSHSRRTRRRRMRIEQQRVVVTMLFLLSFPLVRFNLFNFLFVASL